MSGPGWAGGRGGKPDWDRLQIEYFADIMSLAWECSVGSRLPADSGDKTRELAKAVAVIGQQLFGEDIDVGDNVSREEIGRVLVTEPCSELEAIFFGLCPQGWELARYADVYAYERRSSQGRQQVFLVLMDGRFGFRVLETGLSKEGWSEAWKREAWSCELATPDIGAQVANWLVWRYGAI